MGVGYTSVVETRRAFLRPISQCWFTAGESGGKRTPFR